MSLYRKKDSKYWWASFTVAGQRYRVSTKHAKRKDAERVESLLIADAERSGTSPIRRKAPLLRDFIEVFEKFFEADATELKTKRYYRSGVRLIRQTELMSMPLDKITTEAVQVIRFGGSPSNENMGRRTLRHLLSIAAERQALVAAPRIKLMKEQGRDMVIDQAAEAALLAHSPQPLRDVLILMMDTGMRPSEVFSLRWESVRWAEQRIFIGRGKTQNSRRYVGMSDRAQNVLLARFANQDGWVFPSETSREGHITTLAKAFQKARTDAGLPSKLKLYAARHTFGTVVGEEVGLPSIMRAMGHASAQTAMIYQHPGLDKIRDVINSRNRQKVM